MPGVTLSWNPMSKASCARVVYGQGTNPSSSCSFGTEFITIRISSLVLLWFLIFSCFRKQAFGGMNTFFFLAFFSESILMS